MTTRFGSDTVAARLKRDSELAQSQSVVEARGWRGVFHIALIGLVLLAIGILIFWSFIFGRNTLLYTDIGSDSVNISYPYYVLLSNYLRHVGIPSWSFQVGMGQNLFPYVGTVVVTPVVWLAKEAIAKALVYQHLLYVLIAGILFARFLAIRGLSFGTALLGPLLLSFSAYMCMGSCWYFNASEVVCFTFLLFAAEHAVTSGRWLFLVFAVALIGLFSSFYIYLCALFLSLYVPFRLIERRSLNLARLARTCLQLAAAALLGVALSAIVSVENFHTLLNSPRGSATTSVARKLSSEPVFGLESSLHYITAILRPFGNDMLGTGSNFRGWGNYLEAPVTYAGLICLLILPQVFVAVAWRHRILYGLFLGGLVAATVFPWFRYLFWAFQGDYYRTFSLFSIFGIITLSMTALSRYVEDRNLNLWVLLLTICILLGTLYLPVSQAQAVIDSGLRRAATVFLILYAALLAAGQLMNRQKIVLWTIVGLTAIELIQFDRIAISDRAMVTKQELEERVGYNDETVDAVRDINASDQSFFRITKTWGSALGIYPSLNDAMVFGYYGTSSYSSFNNLDYIRFLAAVDAFAGDSELFTRWSTGLVGHPTLSTFACEKYVVANNAALFQMADLYEFMKRYKDVYVFRNRLFLPLGLTFDRYLPEDVFLNLPSSVKPGALLHAVVISDRNVADKQGLSELTFDELKQLLNRSSRAETIGLRRTTALDIRALRETQIDGTVRVEAKSILVLQTPFDPGWRALVDNHPAQVLRVDAGLLGVALDSGQHAVRLRYTPPFLALGAAVTLVSMIILAGSAWRWPRLALSA